jgi:hypothetical protein
MYWHCESKIPTEVRLNAWPFLLPLAYPSSNRKNETIMTQSYNKSRQQAEIAFGNVQSQFFGRGNAVEEQDLSIQAREDKTARLREARLAKGMLDRSNAVAALTAKRAKFA